MRSMKARISIAGIVVAGLFLSACASGGSEQSASGNEVIKIGLLAPLTGESAADGQAMKQGLEIAIDELNEAGGVAGYDFKIEAIDTQDLQSDAVSAGAQTLINDESVKAVLTSYASANNFEIDIFADAEMPYMVSANAEQTEAIISKAPENYPTVWSTVPSYAPFGTELPKVLEAWDADGTIKLRDKSAFVITSDNPFSQGISKGLLETLDERGWNVVGEETVPYGAVNDWGSILAKVRSTNPDLVINTDYLPANEATFMRQFVANPTNSIMFLQYGPSIPEFLELTKDDAQGILYNLLGDAIISPNYTGSDTMAHLREVTGEQDVNGQLVTLYEQMKLYASVLEEVGDADKKLDIGEKIGASSTQNAFGVWEFDPKTHLLKSGDEYVPLQFIQFQDGKRVTLLPESIADGEFVSPPWYTK